MTMKPKRTKKTKRMWAVLYRSQQWLYCEPDLWQERASAENCAASRTGIETFVVPVEVPLGRERKGKR